MLEIQVAVGQEYYDEEKEEFVYPKIVTLQLEHSLVSISKWESTWCKPFISKTEKTYEETLDYIKCMTLTKNVDDEVYEYINQDHVDKIKTYINAPMTATTFSADNTKKGKSEIITSELIDYWMISLGINFECRKWHLNRLLTLIQVCNIKNTPPKKRSKRDILNQYEAINKANREKFKSKG